MRLLLIIITILVVVVNTGWAQPSSKTDEKSATETSSEENSSSSQSSSSSSEQYSSSSTSSQSSMEDCESSASSKKNKNKEKCASNEHYVNHKKICQRTCSCADKICKTVTGCVCNDGYVRNDKNKCVKLEDCPNPINNCGDNETPAPTDCYNSCYDRRCEDLTSTDQRVCTQECSGENGCYCSEGYYRNSNNECVPACECPSNTCGENETPANGCYNSCFDSYCEDRFNEGSKICPQYCELNGGCFCNKGFYRNDDKKCVPADKCPNPKQCKENEVYRKCSITCPPQTCASTYSSYYCPLKEENNNNCVAGCDCIDGYLRNGTVKDPCIPSEQCPPPNSCTENEIPAPTDCYNACNDRRCEDLTSTDQRVCTQECSGENGCYCSEGNYRNSNNECVPASECPSNTCGENEKPAPTGCYNSCNDRLCEDRGSSNQRICPQVCSDESGCYCSDGFYRDPNNTCVPPSECPPLQCNKEGEEYRRCGSGCDINTCEDYKNPPEACAAVCIDDCFCKKGLVRASNGDCIKPEQCPQCGENEEPTDCYNSCLEVTCENRFTQGKKACPRNCKQGCKCIDGYYKNDKNVCVPANECPPPKCPKDQVYNNCGTACELTCSNYNNPPQVCTAQCVEKCFCEKGLVRAADGSCVKPEQCPPTCGINEEPSDCVNDCDKTCKTRFRDNRICTQQCKKGCACLKGYLRNDHGTCVLIEECSPAACNDDEERNTCGTACEANCANYNPKGIPCTRQCVDGCFCKKGLIRASKDSLECIKPDKCPTTPPVKCGQNEVYSRCKIHCPPQLCSTIEAPIACFAPDYCTEPGCNCKEGYLRNGTTTDLCIPKEKCPKYPKCGPNEHYEGCPNNCPPQTCQSRLELYDCDKIDKSCKPQCRCDHGYLRNERYECVSDCDAEPNSCGANETPAPSGCYNSCNDRYCKDLGNLDQRLCTQQCSGKDGCYCCEGYYRDENNRCVLSTECSPPQCQEGEYYTKCGSPCDLRTCDNYKNPPVACAAVCLDQCFCNKDLVRGPNGNCIKPEQCPPPSCPKGQEYNKCGTACELTCSNYNNPPDACTDQCVEKCFCEKGLVRAEDGSCVEPGQCPPPECPKGQVYNSCGTACEITCSNYHNPPKSCTKQCVRKCFCEKGLIRADDGSCVKPEKCPKSPPKCGKNEVHADCKQQCPPQTCGAFNAKFLFKCESDIPCVPGCDCKEGYTRNGTTTDPCIPTKECPKNPPSSQCGENEEPTDCYNSCLETTCENRYTQGEKSCPKNCKQGCKCIDGYYKNEKNVCVSVFDCPPPKCPKGQVYNSCGTACEITCQNYNNPPKACTLQCVGKCFCEKGLIRADDGSCVRPEKCPKSPPKCGKNEVHADCKQQCPAQTCQALYSKIKCESDIPCTPGCDCKEGYRRNGTITDPCIPTKDCPNTIPPTNTCKGPNEVFQKCKRICPPQTCASKYTLYSCIENIPCESGCDCEKGYLRNGTVNDLCIPSDQCQGPKTEPVCPENEHFEDCPDNCPPQTCDARLARYDCSKFDKTCKPQCRCNNGFLRNKCGVCVSDCDAKPTKKCGKNEVFNECKKDCPPNTCQALSAQYKCRGDQPIKAECDCKEGYRRNGTSTDPCIPEEKCPNYEPPAPQCDLNEEYSECTNSCQKTCKTRFRPDKACSTVCQEGCQCVDGYLRHDNGTCVPTYQCSPPKCNDDEYFPKCGPSCEDNCDNYNNTCRICTRRCATGCFCKDGMVRASDGITCVKKCDCPAPKCTGPHEHYEICPKTCPANTCKAKSTNTDCSKQRKCCSPQCWCDKGYLRNDKGICVRECDC